MRNRIDDDIFSMQSWSGSLLRASKMPQNAQLLRVRMQVAITGTAAGELAYPQLVFFPRVSMWVNVP